MVNKIQVCSSEISSNSLTSSPDESTQRNKIKVDIEMKAISMEQPSLVYQISIPNTKYTEITCQFRHKQTE